MWYPYRPLGFGSSPLLYPLIELEILAPRNNPWPTLGLVDSGADISLLDIEIADHLGLPVRSVAPQRGAGAGGRLFDRYPYPVKVRFAGIEFKLNAAWADSRDPDTGHMSTLARMLIVEGLERSK